MLQKGTMPAAASPAEKVTACPSAIPTSKQRSGISFIRIFIELPDGNDLDAVEAALSKPTMPGKPKAILAHTVKGKGVSFMENQVGWHGKAPNAEQREQALKELED